MMTLNITHEININSSPDFNSLNFNTSLEYVPILLIPKFKINNNNSNIKSTMFKENSLHFRFKSNNWDESKSYNKTYDLKQIAYNNNLGSLFLNSLLSKRNLLEYTEITNDINNLINNFDFSIRKQKDISIKYNYYSNNDYIATFLNNRSDKIRNYEHSNRLTSLKTNYLIDNGFLAISDNNIHICYITMIKKDYIEEFMLLKLLDLPIDNSKIQIWHNNENSLLDKSYKPILSKITKEVKNCEFEIVGKENLNNLISSFKIPKFENISKIKEFDLILTANVLKELYKTEEEVPELKLELNNSPINTVKVKGIRIPKPKVIIPELVD